MTDEGLWITVNGTQQLLRVRYCRALYWSRISKHADATLGDTPKANYHIIGGAKSADKLDAKRAIQEGFLLGLRL